MDEVNRESWNSFTNERAAEYLKTFGQGSVNSKRILLDVLRNWKKELSILELGCGNAQVYEYLKEQGFKCRYSGVDVSEPLLKAASRANPECQFIQGTMGELDPSRLGNRKFDVALFSHVLELVSCPEGALRQAKALADHIIIRFYEPPVHEFETTEIHEMDVGGGKVPTLRRKMSRDHYRLILTKLGCKSVDVYHDEASKDQVHVLWF